MSLLTLTENARAKIDELCQQNQGYAVSLGIKGGGCAGFEYQWGFVEEDQISDSDEIFETENGKLVVDATSLMFFAGTEIDYVNQMFGSMFDIRNPNTKSSCGCGVSVNFDVDKLSF
jgi:iron-sulfur cluster assembly accessory protein